MNQGIDVLKGLIYKLKMMGILIFGSSFIYVDNVSLHRRHENQNPFLKNAIQFAIMQSVCQLQWESPWLDTYPAKRMLQI